MLVVRRPVLVELAPDYARGTHGRVHVDVVVLGICPHGGNERGVGERSHPDDAVLLAGRRRRQLHDRPGRALCGEVDVRGGDVARQVVGDELPFDRAGRLVDNVGDETASRGVCGSRAVGSLVVGHQHGNEGSILLAASGQGDGRRHQRGGHGNENEQKRDSLHGPTFPSKGAGHPVLRTGIRSTSHPLKLRATHTGATRSRRGRFSGRAASGGPRSAS